MSNETITVTADEQLAAQSAFFTAVVRYAKEAGRPVGVFAQQFATGGCLMIERNLVQSAIAQAQAQERETVTSLQSQVQAAQATSNEQTAPLRAKLSEIEVRVADMTGMTDTTGES